MHKQMSSYDQNLLDEAPKATRAQLQEGYNVDLLEQPQPRRTPSVRNPPPSQTTQPAPVTVPLAPGAADTSSSEKPSPAVYTPEPTKSKTSFWRSRNGIITIIVVALVVIGAVVGGAVGGTVNKGSNNNLRTGTSSSGSSSQITPVTTGTATNQGIGGVNTKGASSTSASSPTSTQSGQNAGGQSVGH